MVYYLSTQCLILRDRVGFIEDAVLGVLERNTSETSHARLTVMKIIALRAGPWVGAKGNIIRRKWTETVQTPFSSSIIAVIRVFSSSTSVYITELFSLCIIKRREAIRAGIEVVANTVFVFCTMYISMGNFQKHYMKALLK